jgi:hypothetical protein
MIYVDLRGVGTPSFNETANDRHREGGYREQPLMRV